MAANPASVRTYSSSYMRDIVTCFTDPYPALNAPAVSVGLRRIDGFAGVFSFQLNRRITRVRA